MGTLVDRVTVSAASNLPEQSGVLITVVRKVDNNLELGWTGGMGPYQVYRAANLDKDTRWEPVGAPIESTGCMIPIGSENGFFRVSGR